MGGMWAIVERELRRFRRTPILIVVSLIFPLVQLIVLACLVAHPTRCDEFRLPSGGELSMIQCVRESQMLAAEWQTQHPDWVVRRLSCGLPRA